MAGVENWMGVILQQSNISSEENSYKPLKLESVISLHPNKSTSHSLTDLDELAKENCHPPVYSLHDQKSSDDSTENIPNFHASRKRHIIERPLSSLANPVERYSYQKTEPFSNVSLNLPSNSSYFRPIRNESYESVSPPNNENKSPAETPKRVKHATMRDTQLGQFSNFDMSGCAEDIFAGKENQDVMQPDQKRVSLESYPKPPYSYSFLIVLALKNSKNGYLPVTDIYAFVRRHFPFYETATEVWKNSIRHNLSLSKGFEKVAKYNPEAPSSKKGCLWAMNPEKIAKLDEELAKLRMKDPEVILNSMRYPNKLNVIESGCHGFGGIVDLLKSQYGLANLAGYVRLYMREALLQDPSIQLDSDHWDTVTLPDNPVSINGMYVSRSAPPVLHNFASSPQSHAGTTSIVQQRHLPPSYRSVVNASSEIMPDLSSSMNSHKPPLLASHPNVLKARNMDNVKVPVKAEPPQCLGGNDVPNGVNKEIVAPNLPASFWMPDTSDFDSYTVPMIYGTTHYGSPIVYSSHDSSMMYSMMTTSQYSPYPNSCLDLHQVSVTPSTHHDLMPPVFPGSGSNEVSPFSNSTSGHVPSVDGNDYSLAYGENLFESLNNAFYHSPY